MTDRREQASALRSILQSQFGDAVGTVDFRGGRGTLENVFLVSFNRPLNEGEVKRMPDRHEGCEIIPARNKPGRAFG